MYLVIQVIGYLLFLKATNEEHVQTHETEFPIPNDLAWQLMNYVKQKNCIQEQQPVHQFAQGPKEVFTGTNVKQKS